jgi:hypothetical protein
VNVTRVKAKLLEWLSRYLPLEIAATACSLAGGLGAAAIGMNAGIIAYAATWAENAGFYGYALAREVRRTTAGAPLSLMSRGPTLLQSARTLIAEFGPAEVFDSFVVRPACMYAIPQLTGNLALGLILGKVVADVAFYGLAVAAYEWGKSRR